MAPASPVGTARLRRAEGRWGGEAVSLGSQFGGLKLPEDDLLMLESSNYFLLFTPASQKAFSWHWNPLPTWQTQLRVAGNEARRRLAGALSHPDLGRGVLRLPSLPPTLVAGSGQTPASLA